MELSLSACASEHGVQFVVFLKSWPTSYKIGRIFWFYCFLFSSFSAFVFYTAPCGISLRLCWEMNIFGGFAFFFEVDGLTFHLRLFLLFSFLPLFSLACLWIYMRSSVGGAFAVGCKINDLPLSVRPTTHERQNRTVLNATKRKENHTSVSFSCSHTQFFFFFKRKEEEEEKIEREWGRWRAKRKKGIYSVRW